jgi:hypothetical protein
MGIPFVKSWEAKTKKIGQPLAENGFLENFINLWENFFQKMKHCRKMQRPENPQKISLFLIKITNYLSLCLKIYIRNAQNNFKVRMKENLEI